MKAARRVLLPNVGAFFSSSVHLRLPFYRTRDTIGFDLDKSHCHERDISRLLGRGRGELCLLSYFMRYQRKRFSTLCLRRNQCLQHLLWEGANKKRDANPISSRLLFNKTSRCNCVAANEITFSAD